MKTKRALPPEEDETPPPKQRTAGFQPAKPAPAPPSVPTSKKAAPVADRGAEKRVRRGNLEIDGALDLHGHTQDSGYAALMRFLATAHARGARTVIVVTGQGRGGEGVLKRRFRDWIEARALKSIIAGYAQAHRTHGGAGAYYVFLKRRE